MQLNIFKYIDGISKKFIPNLSIDEEVSLWCNRMVLSGVIYHEGNSLIVHQEYIQDIIHQELTWKNTWLFVSDKIKIKQLKLQCSSRDISVPYILIYRK